MEWQMACAFQEFFKWTDLRISMKLMNLIRFWQFLDDHIYEEESKFAI